MKNFKKLLVWQKGFVIVINTYKITKHLPNDEKFGLTSQINRAAVSIPSNIAEGSSRSSDKDFKRFLEFALGSSFELETQLLISQELSLSNSGDINELLTLLTEEQKMLHKLISVIQSKG